MRTTASSQPRRAEGIHDGLLLDLYELTMAEGYLAAGIDSNEATFSLFVRHLPPGWGYLIAAGLDDALRYLEEARFDPDDLAYLESTGRFSAPLLDRLAAYRFTGLVRAMPEGTVFFADEPVLEVTAPLLEAQLVETAVLNCVHFSSLCAAKAARCVDAARDRPLVDFGMRRAHGFDAGSRAARASYLAGFASTSNTSAGQRYGIPIAGTMAHSFVQAFPDEESAFRAYADVYPDNAILLIDTFDTVEGARMAATVAGELQASGHALRGVRLDSGDLLSLSREVRAILDHAGFPGAIIFASGNLDERAIDALLAARAPIDSFGVGTRMEVSADAPYLDMAYKLVAVDGRPTMKLSTGKATWPGPKQVWRSMCAERIDADVLTTADDDGPAAATPLLVPVMDGGRRVAAQSLTAARERCARERAMLPHECRRLDARPIEVGFSDHLRALRKSIAAPARVP